ncbi:MAG: hypothetical protein C0613_08500 [Desulfobulbaceae bacterium]|nr:MAG: hypothetical protein C0613_08500 [Desulfobulbaceae bacterium]
MIEREDGIIKIKNEEEAWDLFTAATRNKDIGEFKGISFEKWPVVNVNIKGKQYNSSLTTANMHGLVALQDTVYRSYALVHYGSPDTRQLSKKEKKELELIFKVSEGSSGILGNFEKPARTLAEGMVNVMEPHHYIITILGVVLLWGGTSCWKSWLQQRKELKIAQLEKESRQFAGQLEKERMAIFADAIKERPVLVPIQENATEMYNSILKGASDCSSISIPGVEDLEGDTVRTLVKSSRTKAKEIQLNGPYRIKKVNSSNSDAFTMEIYNQKTGQTFNATLQDTFVKRGRNKDLLQQAEWGRKPVYLQVNAKDIKGSITGATIIGVEEIPEKEGQQDG